MGVNQPLAESCNVTLTRKKLIGNHSFDRPEAFYHLTKAGSLGEQQILLSQKRARKQKTSTLFRTEVFVK
jgi:hypothetical protein